MPAESIHGKVHTYKRRKCRCEDCCAANTAYVRGQRARRTANGTTAAYTHGTPSAYSNGCRCDPCTDAHRDYMREYYRRKKEAERATL